MIIVQINEKFRKIIMEVLTYWSKFLVLPESKLKSPDLFYFLLDLYTLVVCLTTQLFHRKGKSNMV